MCAFDIGLKTNDSSHHFGWRGNEKTCKMVSVVSIDCCLRVAFMINVLDGSLLVQWHKYN